MYYQQPSMSNMATCLTLGQYFNFILLLQCELQKDKMLSLNNEEFLTLHGIQNENVKNKMHDCCIHTPLNQGSLCQKFGYTFGNFLGGIENCSICFQTCHFLFCYDGPYIPENKNSFKTWYVLCTYFSKTIRNRFLGFYGMYVYA